MPPRGGAILGSGPRLVSAESSQAGQGRHRGFIRRSRELEVASRAATGTAWVRTGPELCPGGRYVARAQRIAPSRRKVQAITGKPISKRLMAVWHEAAEQSQPNHRGLSTPT